MTDRKLTQIGVNIEDIKKAQTVERLHEVLFENAQDIILYANSSGQIIGANQQACQSYGYTKELLVQLRVQDLRHDSTLIDYEHQMLLAKTHGVTFESIHQKSDGTAFPVEVSARSVDTASGLIRIHIIRDITKRKEQSEQIVWLASHDGLTGILNRSSLLKELELELERAKRSATTLAVFLFDIDKFKQVNDVYGHEAGDLILKTLAKRVSSVLRKTDHFGRLGGDEFVVVMANADQKEDVFRLIERIRESIQPSTWYKDREIKITISLGISLFPQDASEEGELLNLADQAMYRTKNKGGNGYSFVFS